MIDYKILFFVFALCGVISYLFGRFLGKITSIKSKTGKKNE